MGALIDLSQTAIEGLHVATSGRRSDTRGSFARWFCRSTIQEILGARDIRQVNHSRTESVGAVRGLHFQRAPHCETKFIRCIRGRVWDIVVDLRMGSPTFLAWHAEELSPADDRMLVVPEGFAHGFQVLEPSSEMLYLHTADYAPSSEDGLRWDEPRLDIPWPLEVTELSIRDRQHPLLGNDFWGIST